MSAQLLLLPRGFIRLFIGSSAKKINLKDAGSVPSGMPSDGSAISVLFGGAFSLTLKYDKIKIKKITFVKTALDTGLALRAPVNEKNTMCHMMCRLHFRF